MDNLGTIPAPLPASSRGPALISGVRRQVNENRLIAAGAAIALVIIIIAALVPLLPLADPLEPDYDAGLSAPSAEHLLGTDLHGRDQLSRVLWASRTSLTVGITASLVALAIGFMMGGAAGYGGRIADAAFMRIADAFLSFPVVLGAIAFMAVFGPGIRNVFMAIAFFGWPVFARVFRSSVLSIKEQSYVSAAKGLGGGSFYIFRRHVLPNSVQPLIAYTAMSVAGAILIESGLSFINLGIQRPYPSWGLMLGEAMGQIDLAPWLLIAPGAAITITTMAFFLMGTGLSRKADPRMQGASRS